MIGLAAIVGSAAPAVRAQHVDVLLQDLDGRLASGSADFDSGAWTLGRRVYAAEFDSDYSVNNPGFNALAAGSPALPADSAALPPGVDLGWDFLPMKIDGVAANLFYWNGAGAATASVDFGDLPGPDYSLSIYGRNSPIGVDGAAELVPGDVIDTTASDGSVHRHRFFFLDSGNFNATTTPPDGIYLFAIRASIAGVDSSAPIYFVWGTPGSTLAALQAAESWVNDRVDQLAPDFAADFNGDLAVDGADFLNWQRNLGMTEAARHIHGDANRDHAVDGADLAVWQAEFGLNLDTFPGASSATSSVGPAPEPSATTLAGIGIVISTLAHRAARSRPRRHAGGGMG